MEYQDITQNNSEGFFNGVIKYNNIIGLSGTHPEHIEKREIYRKLGLKIIVKMSIDDAVEKETLADYQINVVQVDLDNVNKNIEAGNKEKRFMTTEYKQYDYLNNMVRRLMFAPDKDPKFMILKRLRAIYNSPSKEMAADWLINKLEGRKLVFCGGIDQAERLGNYTYHSKTNDIDLNRFLKEEIDSLFCVNAGGIGFTYRKVDHFVIIQANSNKKGDSTQKLARSLLKQVDYKANIWFLVLSGTQDEKWMEKALESFDKSKIKYYRFKNLKNGAETF